MLDGIAMGFNYNALDSFEFETLARDVTEMITGVKLSCYTAGADGGVDASDFYYQKCQQSRVVMQAKHWLRRVTPKQWEDLVGNLFKQLKKLNKVPSDKLVIVTSAGVTENIQHKMIDTAESLGVSCCIVIDRIKLDDMLAREECKPILKRHFKLWIAGTNVLNLMLNRSLDVDTKVFLNQIYEHEGLYTQTSIFDKAIESLGQNSTLLIVGDPGTGKSVLTQMIALQLIKADFKIIYSSCNNIDRIKNAIEDDCEKTLFILDDFLGQRCLDVDSSKMRELVTLLRYTSKLKNCHTVLNSRISILNEAKRIDDPFKKFIDSMRAGIVVIDTTEMSLLDKARIMLANLSFEKVPIEYVDSLRGRSQLIFPPYMKCIDICKHSNFNPRIIEFCCRDEFRKNIAPSEFPDAIKDKLDHPNDVWQNEFEERLEKPERILAYQLFSLGDNSVPLSSLHIAYEERLSLESQTDYSINTFEKALKRLQETVIRTVYIESEPYVSMANPSVNDYCAWFLANNNLEAIAMAKSIVFVDQLERITNVNHCPEVVSIMKNTFITGQIYDFPFADNKLSLYELGFKSISNCEEVLSESDFDWAADFIKNALESSTQEARSLTASNLLSKLHKWGILESKQIAERPYARPLLRSLIAGTSYIRAPRLLEIITFGIDKELVEDLEDVKEDLCFRSRDWFRHYVTDYLYDNYVYERDLDICKRYGPCGDDEDWENFVRHEIKKQLKSEFTESTLKEYFVEYLDADIANIFLAENYSEEMDVAIDSYILDDAFDNYIWNLAIPDQESVFEPYSKSAPPLFESRENLIVEKLFNDYQ